MHHSLITTRKTNQLQSGARISLLPFFFLFLFLFLISTSLLPLNEPHVSCQVCCEWPSWTWSRKAAVGNEARGERVWWQPSWCSLSDPCFSERKKYIVNSNGGHRLAQNVDPKGGHFDEVTETLIKMLAGALCPEYLDRAAVLPGLSNRIQKSGDVRNYLKPCQRLSDMNLKGPCLIYLYIKKYGGYASLGCFEWIGEKFWDIIYLHSFCILFPVNCCINV